MMNSNNVLYGEGLSRRWASGKKFTAKNNCKKMSEESPQFAFEDAKAYLQMTNENGKSVYDILLDLVSYLQEHNTLTTINVRDLIKFLVVDSFKQGEKAGYEELWNLARPNPESCSKAREIIDLLSKQKEVMNGIFSKRRAELNALSEKKQEDAGDADPAEAPPSYKYLYSNPQGVSNLIEDFYAFETVGIALPKEEISKLQIAMYNLKSQKKLNYVRFFGKILGTSSNYYIFESNYYFEEKVEEDDVHESGGKPGINRFTYWVLSPMSKSEGNSVGFTSFEKLPDANPSHINAARNINTLFTGNLKSSISSYPEFPGLEASYLRCQIARISHACTLAPQGLFDETEIKQDDADDADENNKKKNEIKYKELLPPMVSEKEGFELKNPDDMKSLEQWVHIFPGILKTGYVTKIKAPGDDEGASEETDKDPVIPALRSLNEDEAMKKSKEIQKTPKKEVEEGEDATEEEGKDTNKGGPCWRVRSSNTNKLTCHHKSFKTVLLSSLRWEGAHTFYRLTGPQCHFGTVYIGNGVKSTGVPFTPVFPPKVVDETKEPVDQVDPKPNDEKRMLQGLEPGPQEVENPEVQEGDEAGDDVEDDE